MYALFCVLNRFSNVMSVFPIIYNWNRGNGTTICGERERGGREGESNSIVSKKRLIQLRPLTLYCFSSPLLASLLQERVLYQVTHSFIFAIYYPDNITCCVKVTLHLRSSVINKPIDKFVSGLYLLLESLIQGIPLLMLLSVNNQSMLTPVRQERGTPQSNRCGVSDHTHRHYIVV